VRKKFIDFVKCRNPIMRLPKDHYKQVILLGLRKSRLSSPVLKELVLNLRVGLISPLNQSHHLSF